MKYRHNYLLLISMLLLGTFFGSLQNIHSQNITTIAGNGNGGYSGDGNIATLASLWVPASVVIDKFGNKYIADTYNNCVRKVTIQGIITTYAGAVSEGMGYSGDGGLAVLAQLNGPNGLAIDSIGNLYISDCNNFCIRMVNTKGIITTIAGGGFSGVGDGGLATNAQLQYPTGIVLDKSGNLYIADWSDQRIRKVSKTGFITTVAGIGIAGFSGDGNAATSAKLNYPAGVAVDNNGNLYISDYQNSRIRKVNSNGIITTIAGNGTNGFSGDGGGATFSVLNSPYGITVDANGNVYFSDQINYRIRKINTNGIITTVAGNGSYGFGGDGGKATSALLANPYGVALDFAGNLFIVDHDNNVIRQVTNLSVSSFSPTYACSGNNVEVYGVGFLNAISVSIGNLNAVSFSIISDTHITALFLADSSGQLSVTNASGTATSNNYFTILKPSSYITNQSACGSYNWNGKTYSLSGTYTYDTKNAIGCDSMATLILTINKPTTSATEKSACGSYNWNGKTYLSSGTYTYDTTNAFGCDSTATLVLTITNCQQNYVWTGNGSTDWNDASNWSNGILPNSSSSIKIPSAPINQPVLNESVTVSSILLDGFLSLNGRTITIKKEITGTGFFVGSITSSMVIAGAVGSINLESSNNSLKDLTIDGTAALGNNLNLYGTLFLNSGQLTTNSNLTLKSVSKGTAIVAPVSGRINGTVTVERYIPKGYAAFRDLGVSVSGAGTITNTWGQNLYNYKVYNYDANGWSASLTGSTNLQPYKGYRTLVTGNKNPVVPSGLISNMNSDVTLTYSGTLLTGDQNIPLNSGTDKFTFIANPYQSQVDFSQIINLPTTSGLYNGYWYLDPTTLYGSYENYNYYGTDLGTSNIFSGVALSQYLQSNQAFFVCSNSSYPSLTFSEIAKNNMNAQLGIFGAQTSLNRIAIGLFIGGKNVDGAVVVFNSKFSKGKAKEDGLKISNQGENITFTVDDKDLCANGWSLPTATDILPIHLYNLSANTKYIVKLDASQFNGNGLNAYLKDNVLNTKTLLAGANNEVSFTTGKDINADEKRYSIGFDASTLPVCSINLSATWLPNNQVALFWNTDGQIKVSSYKLQRSSDGETYADIATVALSVTTNYSYIDAQTFLNGTNYYRIKTTDLAGEVTYSTVVSINNLSAFNSMVIFPNPVVNNSFSFILPTSGKYLLGLYDNTSRLVQSAIITSLSSTKAQNINLNSNLSTGIYTLKLTDAKGKIFTTQLFFK